MSLYALALVADQCAWVTQAIAEKAAARLKKGEVLQEICRPCGEKKAKPLWIDNTKVAKTSDPKLYEVQVNGRGLDLAYVFVKDKGDWVNLGLSVQCGVGVTATKLKLEKSDLSEP
jgi:hypothetical protein